jgi:hypothetical protein
MVPSKRLAPARRLTGVSVLVLAVLLSGAVSTAAFAQVQVQSLAAPDLFSTPAGEAGLAGDLWKDASPGIVRDVLPRLAAKPLSPASIDLARRVLATGANAPAGIGDDPDLGAARATALIALGDAKGADTVLDRVPGVAGSPALSQAAAEAALITGADDKACRIGEALSVERGAAYWLRLRAFCQVLAGQHDAAQLTLSLALQQAKDPDYARLMGAAISGTPAGAANLRNGLNYALSRKLGLDLQAAAATASPALKPVLKPTGDMTALAGGDLTAAQTSDLAFLRQAKGLAAFTDAAKASLPSISALTRADAPLEDPMLFARAALAAGDLATAQAIRGRLTGDTIPGGATATDLALLDAALAAGDGRKDSQILDGLIERAAQAGPKSPTQPAALILAAFGGAMSPEARARFASLDPGKSTASAARLTALDDAAAAGRKGEAALLALSVSADAGTAGPGPVDRARLVRALLKAGLEVDARALAVEGLLALQVK